MRGVSGEDIPRDARDRLRMLSGADFIFEKVAVTKHHVLTLDLPPAPESEEEIQKLKRDSRYPRYIQQLKSDPKLKELAERYGGLVRVELDALVALKLEEFKKIVKEAIEKHFDWNVFNSTTKAKEEELKAKASDLKQATLAKIKELIKKK